MTGSFRFTSGFVFLSAYFCISILIGWVARRHSRGSSAYLNASGALPLWIVTAAYLAANCGALEIIGLSAMAAEYGVQALHFYLIGAVPAMIFLALWMMPVYRHSGVHSVPEYLRARFGPGMQLLNACILATIMLLLAGISLYAMAQVLQVVVGLQFATSVMFSAGIVLSYTLLGGIRATIYNEVFQLGVMVIGLVPLSIRSWHLAQVTLLEKDHAHLWKGVPLYSHSAHFDHVGLIFGLGFVLSFGYWCTDFVLMQRAFAARTDFEARQVPLWAGFGKMLFSLLVVLPGLAASQIVPNLGHGQRFDRALPMVMISTYGPVMIGLGLTALVASLMSGLAANVSAFAAIWTEDIYQARICRGQTDTHYLRVGRLAATVAIIVSSLASYLNFLFSNLMEHVQLIFSVFGAPFWAIFLLGMSTRRTSSRGAFVGFCSGAAVALLHLLAVARGWIHYGSRMNFNFYTATFSFLVALFVGWVSFPNAEVRMQSPSRSILIFRWKLGLSDGGFGLLVTMASLLLLTCIAVNCWLW